LLKKSSAIYSLSLLLLSAAANAATAGSTIGAEIVTGITITNTTGLQFGQLSSSVTAGTVSVSTAGVRSSAGGVTLRNGTTVTAASFDVAGTANNTYSITLPADGATVLTGAGDPMTVNFVSFPSGSGRLSGAGAQTLLVGATLSIGASQAAGPVAGSFNVVVAYN
jgi:hypothetical protein